MALRFHNTLGNRMEEFVPQTAGVATLYTCGPTVYNHPHIGNFRYFVFTDILRRSLRYCGYEVKHALNITDVDDKIIRDANGRDIREFCQPYVDAFFNDLDRMHIERAEFYPRATDHINEIASAVKSLQAKGHAYESEGSYYFKIGSFPDYGKLSRLDKREIKVGARVDNDEYEKGDVRDFALWKGPKESEGLKWETEIGAGRPGWHIECTVMAMKYLGETLDIHAGGEDLIFPHHENEIAQSECLSGKPFARYWLHPRHLLVNGEKMSKSKGNFFTIQDLIDKGHSPLAIRYTMLASHYRSPLNFTEEAARGAAGALERQANFRLRMKDLPAGDSINPEAARIADETAAAFRASIENDLDIPGALARVFDMVSAGNTLFDTGSLSAADGRRFLDCLNDADRVLGILDTSKSATLEEEIQRLIDERQAARKNRDFARSDAIRDELAARGIVLEDTKEGVRWKWKT